jgi:glycosyltransferase involved in cell wall biosynthesis
VTLTGTLSEAEIYRLLAAIDAFILPSTGLGEAWPVSVMEAMGAGLPVIASIIGATSDMIMSEKDGFLVPQGDEQALLHKIILLGKDVELRRRVGTAARITAQRRFDVKLSANLLRNTVHQVIASQSGQPNKSAVFANDPGS